MLFRDGDREKYEALIAEKRKRRKGVGGRKGSNKPKKIPVNPNKLVKLEHTRLGKELMMYAPTEYVLLQGLSFRFHPLTRHFVQSSILGDMAQRSDNPYFRTAGFRTALANFRADGRSRAEPWTLDEAVYFATHSYWILKKLEASNGNKKKAEGKGK